MLAFKHPLLLTGKIHLIKEKKNRRIKAILGVLVKDRFDAAINFDLGLHELLFRFA
jgi:hypothetical protein